jgi:hypothetical protein
MLIKTTVMNSRNRSLRFRSLCVIGLAVPAFIAFAEHYLPAQTAHAAESTLEPSFEQVVKPFFKKNCVSCHNSDLSTAASG